MNHIYNNLPLDGSPSLQSFPQFMVWVGGRGGVRNGGRCGSLIVVLEGRVVKQTRYRNFPKNALDSRICVESAEWCKSIGRLPFSFRSDIPTRDGEQGERLRYNSMDFSGEELYGRKENE